MPKDLVTQASKLLDETWQEICALAKTGRPKDSLHDERLPEDVRRVVASSTKSYRYVLPTQFIAKLADPDLDCRCLQASRGGPGAFDARTVAHKVAVPFDQANDNVLGGPPEPYVNNPLRVPELSERYRAAQKNQGDWDRLCAVPSAVETKGDAEFTGNVLKRVLTEVYRRLTEVRVVYPAPKRISLEKSLSLIEGSVADLSGGDRLLALTSALFAVIGKRFRLYSDVKRASITSADAATGMLAE